MRRLILPAAALVFLTLPALAQPGGDRDRGHGGQPQQNQAAPHAEAAQERPHGPTNRGHEPNAAPTAQTAAPDHGDRGRMNGNGGDRRGVQQAAPAMQAAPQYRGDRDRGDLRGQDRTNSNFANRPGGQSFGARPGGQNFGNRPGGQNFANPGARRDFSNFRDYHRSFNAPRRFQAPAYRRPNGWYGHRWSFGEFLPSLFWAPSYWLNDYYSYGLPPPPYGAVWVRDGYDALLIDRDSGEIIAVEYDVFY